jgi:acyl-coenzyme A synthetase/AMP-(fatty) acid ligase
MDIFGALLNGATLCPKDIRQDGLLDFEKWLVGEGITIYHSIPTLFRSVVRTLDQKQHFPKLRLVVLGGEAVFRSDVDAFRQSFGPNCRLVNILGPTESTIGSMYFIDADTIINRNLVPIGYEVDETEFLLLDESGQRTDIYGEIAIRSPYIAIGYWQNADLTQKAFVPDLLGEHRAMYRTGDLARLLPNGSYEFVGRKDFQVKIRGFRIELGDIESTLKSHPTVKDTIVISRESDTGDMALVAYVVTKSEGSVKSAELRDHLEKRLPDYMVPTFYVFLNALPVTPNGKIDRRALPAPDFQIDNSGRQFEAPRNATEEVVAGIWSEVLGRAPIGAYDNFFALGGHSLLATQVLSRLRESLQVNMPLRILFESPTVAAFAQIVLQDPETRPQIEKRARMVVKVSGLSDEELNSMVKEKGLVSN